jgi:anti-sigma regulatory factor (Ser/Thr protein kinase)
MARARAAVSAWLASGHGHSAPYVEIAQLLVSELVTNALQHASSASGTPLHLRGRLSETTCRIELWNPGTHRTVAPVAPRGDGAEGGFGLAFVARLSEDWGVGRDAHGTTVWFVLRNAIGAAT